jgi:hypothetical protein
MEQGGRGNFEARVVRQDGELIDTLWSLYWSPPKESLFCFVQNMTERKTLEELLSAQEEQVRLSSGSCY